MPRKSVLRVGNAGGYWGDDPHALARQLAPGDLDYVTQDFLAEITMSILQKLRARNPELGYATDFVDQVEACFPLLARHSTRLISNAGGINPRGCAEKVDALARRAGHQFRIAVIEGDDLLDRIDELAARGIELNNMETGRPLSDVRDRVTSANAYLGVGPVLKALQENAQIVISGRVTDTAITAAPPVFEFDWDPRDWNRLASAIVAGHILECGAQSTGGNISDWEEIPSFLAMGYPIAEFARDGSFQVTRHPGSGGLVDRKAVVSQLVYEMGDPRRYITPDVVADFSSIQLEETEQGVRISGVQGAPAPDRLKVSISYQAGFKAHGTLIVSRPRAVDKCERIAEALWQRLGLEFEETSTERVGFNACHGRLAPAVDPPEVLLRLGVRDSRRDKVEEFARTLTSLILNTVSGVAIVGARPRVQDVVAYWPALIPAEEVTPVVHCLDTRRSFSVAWVPPGADWTGPLDPLQPPVAAGDSEATGRGCPRRSCRLIDLCYARSGDKGDTANIGVVARNPAIYHWLREQLTARRVREYFEEICRGEVERFEVPNLWALNFLLHESLGGGGTVSLRIDPQGKTLADALLMMEVEVPESLLPKD